MSTISVIGNKIKVIPTESVVITILKKELINGIVTDTDILVSDSLDTTFISNELEDGVYQVLLSSVVPVDNIVFITSEVDEQKALFSTDCIKTKSISLQRNFNVYYDLIAFSLMYDTLISAIDLWISGNLATFTDTDILNYFNTIKKYYKYATI